MLFDIGFGGQDVLLPALVRLLPHFHHIGTVIALTFQLAQAQGKVHASAAKGDTFELTGEVRCDGQGILQMNGCDLLAPSVNSDATSLPQAVRLPRSG
ncbi:hypothetical protein DXC40_08430 [Anaerotruncus colihominis]|uniref:Uncharacterized protein n=1 Tax=Anaerotruncus colihominis TaxID=169435 RepID=A0A3E3IMN2_9FIRM|nr:hypothetical protein DXC40_08430 [Anaerotruncus colihominis]